MAGSQTFASEATDQRISAAVRRLDKKQAPESCDSGAFVVYEIYLLTHPNKGFQLSGGCVAKANNIALGIDSLSRAGSHV